MSSILTRSLHQSQTRLREPLLHLQLLAIRKVMVDHDTPGTLNAADLAVENARVPLATPNSVADLCSID